MKWMSFEIDGKASYGVVEQHVVIDVGRRMAAQYPTLRSAIAAGAAGPSAEKLKSSAPSYPLSKVKFLSPIPDPEQIICIGRNYAAHASEAGVAAPEFPSLFIRLTSSLAPHNSPMICPKLSGDFDYECELALVIGKAGRHIPRENALDHVFGYSCFNDGSIRDVQFKHSTAAGKNFVATGGIGPWIVTVDEIPDPSRLTIMTRINGRELQHAPIADMIFDVQAIISYVSGFTRLLPGDILSTGTPDGVGFPRKPPLWLKPGDVVEVETTGIGILRNPIIAEP
jgi:2-keto-4-pentenoate hydratase/2-oxohepta-3-ene-1,7-dioic acid hydratase in catechol pathway